MSNKLVQPKRYKKTLIEGYEETVTLGKNPKQVTELEKVCERSKQDINTLKVQSGIQSIIHQDTRKLVENTLQYPYSCIGRITFNIKETGQRSHGTGFLIGPNIVLTAAHNLFNSGQQKQNQNFAFYPAQNARGAREFKVKNVKYLEDFAKSIRNKDENQQRQTNYGIMILYQKAGDICGYLGLDFSGEFNGTAAISGYPDYLFHQGKKTKNEKKDMYSSQGHCTKSANLYDILQYEIPTTKGNSGSPIYYKDSWNNFIAVGVHTFGTIQKNSGILLTQQKREQINQWIAQQVIELKLLHCNRNIANIIKSGNIQWQQLIRIDLGSTNLNDEQFKILCLRSIPQLVHFHAFTLGKKPKQVNKLENVCERPKQDINTLTDQSGIQSIIHQDTRKLVENTLQYPYCCIGRITFNIKETGQRSHGTGFLIGPNIVLTAAHNLFNIKDTEQFQNFAFYPAENAKGARQFKVKNVKYPKDFAKSIRNKDENRQRQTDYGIMILQQKAGDIYGYLGLDFSGKFNGTAAISGYSGYLFHQGKKTKNEKNDMYSSQGHCTKSADLDDILQYEIPTTGGNSGGPIYYKDKNNFIAAGVHTFGTKQKNSGILLTQQKRKQINKWIDQQVIELNLVHYNTNIVNIIKSDNIQWQKLIRIDLGSTNLNDEQFKILCQRSTQQLEYLHLSANNITDNGIQYIKDERWGSLKYLNLANNKIGDQGFGRLYRVMLQFLKTIILQQNKITDKGIETTVSKQRYRWLYLQKLYLDYNKITKNSFERLKSIQTRQNLTIFINEQKIEVEKKK